MDAHLEHVPGLRTLTARGLAGGVLKDLGREADGALDAEVLALRTLDEVGGHYRAPNQPLFLLPPISLPSHSHIHSQYSSYFLSFLLSQSPKFVEKRTLLKRLDLPRGEGDTDAVDLGTFPELALLLLVVRHFVEAGLGRKDLTMDLDC